MCRQYISEQTLNMSDNALDFHIGTSTLGSDNCVLSSYLPDGTLMAREFRLVCTIVDDVGKIRQCMMYYSSGLPVQLFGTERVTDRVPDLERL